MSEKETKETGDGSLSPFISYGIENTSILRKLLDQMGVVSYKLLEESYLGLSTLTKLCI